jgi:hypothetical protein
VGDKIKIICSRCKKPFRVSAVGIRPGHQTQCTHCLQIITLDSDATDLTVRRALANAREIRSGGNTEDPSFACSYLDNYRAKSTKFI